MTATALGLVNTLRAKTRTVDPSAIKDDDYGWGTFKVRHVSRRAFRGQLLEASVLAHVLDFHTITSACIEHLTHQ